MAKIKFVKHPRSIIQKRRDHPSSLFVSIPKRIVQKTTWQAGDIIEFHFMVEDDQAFVKAMKLKD